MSAAQSHLNIYKGLISRHLLKQGLDIGTVFFFFNIAINRSELDLKQMLS